MLQPEDTINAYYLRNRSVGLVKKLSYFFLKKFKIQKTLDVFHWVLIYYFISEYETEGNCPHVSQTQCCIGETKILFGQLSAYTGVHPYTCIHVDS